MPHPQPEPPIRLKRIQTLLQCFPDLTLLVVGDYFLDRYLLLNRDLSEISLETGLEAQQVTEIRNNPGAAGSAANNLAALDTRVIALGAIGLDGHGFDLKTALVRQHIEMDHLLESGELVTPTYIKPMRHGANEPTHELERLDVKNRRHLPADIEKRILAQLDALIPVVDGVLIVDQVQEANCGVVTDAVRDRLALLAARFPDKPMLVDSRLRSALFCGVIVKCNHLEALHITGKATVEAAAIALSRQNARGVFVTLGEAGILTVSGENVARVRAVPVSGEIDICGAGDSAAAGILSALCVGATFAEAAMIGNLTASITIQQLGTTGVASRAGILKRAQGFLGA